MVRCHAHPPSECLKIILSRMAGNRKNKIAYADVSRAYFYAKANRPVYVKLPEEDQEPGDENKCGKLLMSMYGTRDAAVNWSSEYTATLLADGYKQGSSNPCLFYHPTTDVAVMVHGDDFIAVGDEKSLKGTRATLEDRYKLKVETLGEGPACKQEIRVLNKVLRRTPEGLELEADPRHAEIVVRELGLTNAKTSKVPGAKEPRKHDIVKNGGREVLVIDEDHYLKGEFSPDCYLDDFGLNVDELENQEEEDGEEFL